MAQSLALAVRKLTGVANRTLTKAQTFADQYGVEKVYDTVEDLYADPDIDAVYITTPPNTTWSLWTLPRCSTCPCIKSCAAAWMPASLAT